jgi:hypothetical protein
MFVEFISFLVYDIFTYENTLFSQIYTIIAGIKG